MYYLSSQLLQIPSTTSILFLLLVPVVAFIVSYVTLSFSLTLSFQSAHLRAQVAACVSQLAASISGLASFPRLAILTSEPILRQELASFRSEIDSLTSEIADLQREWRDLNSRYRRLERDVAGFNTLMGRSKNQSQDTRSSISVQQEMGCVGTDSHQDQESLAVERDVLSPEDKTR